MLHNINVTVIKRVLKPPKDQITRRIPIPSTVMVLTNHNVDSIVDPEYFYKYLLSDTVQNHPH